jgi:hypothetical protein
MALNATYRRKPDGTLLTEKEAKFFRLFMGGCWHRYPAWEPWSGNKAPTFPEIHTFMEEKWPKILLAYYEQWVATLVCIPLLRFLLEDEQVKVWGWVECPDKQMEDFLCRTDTSLNCPVTEGCCNKYGDYTGQIQHPALRWAIESGLKEEK